MRTSLHARGRHVRPRTRRAACLVAVATAAALALSLPPEQATAETGDPCRPVLRKVSITQGLGEQTTLLVRGKTTLVQLFLGAGSCAPPGGLEFTGGQLSVRAGTTPLATVPTTPAALGPVYPIIDSVGVETPATSPANPLFQVPLLAATTTASSVSFEATIRYRYRASASSDWVPGLATYSKRPDGSNIAVTVAPKSNALRLLAVPMGDGGGSAGAPPARQFPMLSNGGTALNGQYADTTVQNGMHALSRVMPLADGVGDLTSVGNGLKYRLVTSSMIDLVRLGVMSSGGKFCGTSGNFSAISRSLADFLNDWNTNNPPEAQADRIIGVVWQGVSTGGNGCAEGWGSYTGRQAWVRTFADRVGPPTSNLSYVGSGSSMTGPLLGMEVTHTFGGAPSAPGRSVDSGRHSPNTQADTSGSAPSYNAPLAQWLSGPLSIMKYSGTSEGYTDGSVTPSQWNNNTTAFEPVDFRYNQCVVTPQMPSGSCPNNPASGTGSVGSAGGAPAGGGFVLGGITDGTSAGTKIHSYFTEQVEPSDLEPSSVYRLVQRSADGAVVRDDGIPVQFVHSLHDGSTHTEVTGGRGAISSVVPFGVPGGAPVRSFELRIGSPAGAAPCDVDAPVAPCLFARQASVPPVIASYAGPSSLTDVRNVSRAAGSDTSASLSRDGSVVAWVDETGLRVLRADSSDGAAGALTVPGTAGAMDPSWSASSDGTTPGTIAYSTAAGDIVTVPIFWSGSDLSAGAKTTVYDHSQQVIPAFRTGKATSPSFSKDGRFLAVALDGGIWRIRNSRPGSTDQTFCDLTTQRVTLTCELLVADGSAPSWSWPQGSTPQLIAFEAAVRDGAGNVTGRQVRTIDAPTADPVPGPVVARPQTLRLPAASAPAWAGSLLAYVDAGSVWVADSRSAGPDGVWTSRTRVTFTGVDAAPSGSGDGSVLAFDRPVDGERDVFLASRGDSSDEIRFTATSQNARHLLGGVTLTCPTSGTSTYEPILVALSGVVEGNSATFVSSYRDEGACPGGKLFARVADGYHLSAPVLIRQLPGPTPGNPLTPPSPAIAAPPNGAVYLQYDPVIALGSGIETASGTNPAGVTAAWSLQGPHNSGFDGTTVLGSDAARLQLDPPIDDTRSGWVPGAYTLTLTLTGPGGSASTSTVFHVLPDPGHARGNVDVQFNPQTLFVPSSGSDLSLRVVPRGQDLSKITPSTVQITGIGRHATAFMTVRKSGWLPNGDGSFTAKFDRQLVSCFMTRHNLVGSYVPVAVTASGDGVRIRGLDARYPSTTPASSPTTC